MDNQSKPKSLILQEVVSENPEKILFGKRRKKSCIMGDEVSSFLGDIINKESSIKNFVMELGMRRNLKNSFRFAKNNAHKF